MSKFVNVNNEPNVKLPELPDRLPDLIDKLNVFEQLALLDEIQNYARAAVALNTPSVDADECTCHLSATAWRDCSVKHHAATGVGEQGAVAEVCEDSTGCKYLSWSVDWFEDHKELPPVGTKLYDHTTPTGVDGVATELYDALTNLVYHDGNKWRVGIIPDADVTDIVGAVMTKAAISLAERK